MSLPDEVETALQRTWHQDFDEFERNETRRAIERAILNARMETWDIAALRALAAALKGES